MDTSIWVHFRIGVDLDYILVGLQRPRHALRAARVDYNLGFTHRNREVVRVSFSPARSQRRTRALRDRSRPSRRSKLVPDVPLREREAAVGWCARTVAVADGATGNGGNAAEAAPAMVISRVAGVASRGVVGAAGAGVTAIVGRAASCAAVSGTTLSALASSSAF